MARRAAISFKKIAPRIVGILGMYRPARIQRFEIRGNFPTTDIQEHGNQELAGIVYDIPDYTVTLSAFDVSHKIFAALTGTDPEAYPTAGVSINALDTVDIVGDVKDESVMDYVKSMYIRKARPQSIRMAYTVEGQATEEYTFAASTRQLFTHDVVVDVLSAASSPQTASETPEILKNGNYCISVILDGTYLTEVAAAPATGEYAVSGTDVSFAGSGTTLMVTYKAAPAGTAWTWISDTTIPPAISGKDVPITISAIDTSTDTSIPRVQSVNISANLRADAIREQGNSEIVGYETQVPEVTGDITVLDTDQALLALFSTGSYTSTDTEFRSCELLDDYNLALKVELRDPSTPCSSTSSIVVKTIYVEDIQLTGESYVSNVGNNVNHTFNFRSSAGNLLVFSGEYSAV